MTLVHQVYGCCSSVGANFDWMSDKAAWQNSTSPEGCDENGPAAALLLSHVLPPNMLLPRVRQLPDRRPIFIATLLH
jgi:hypothetical protein